MPSVIDQDFVSVALPEPPLPPQPYIISGRVVPTTIASGMQMRKEGILITLVGSMPPRWTVTDENGDYQFSGLPNGSYAVYGVATGAVINPQTWQAITINNNNGTANFTTNYNTLIGGTIRTNLGVNLANVRVYVSGPRNDFVLTNASGVYTFGANNSFGSYVLTPELAGYTFDPVGRSNMIYTHWQNQDFTAYPV